MPASLYCWLFARSSRRDCWLFAATRPLLTLLLLSALVACDEQSEPLPKLTTLQSLSLLDQNDDPFTLERLQGKWSVANFIFTSCPTVCPVMTQRAVALHKRLSSLGDRVQFVSISVDPEVDTPKVLRRYAVQQGAKHDDWWFLTGETAAIGQVAQQGFRVAVGERVAHDEGYDILHATHFILVDPTATVRGYYRSDDEGMSALERDLRGELEP